MNAHELRKYFNYQDGKLVWKESHSSNAPAGSNAGHTSKDGYTRISLNGKMYLAHRVIFAMHNEILPKQIDHINGNRADNRIENLRPATLNQNQHNAKLRKDNTSGVKGVTWNKNVKKWCVRLWVDGKMKAFGNYFDIDYAKFVADAMRHKYHKEFANNG